MSKISVGEQMRCPDCGQYMPDRCTCNKPVKGDKGGPCNRTACQQIPANWFNHSTRKYYCDSCAHDLNEFHRNDSMELYGHDLCTKGKGE